MTAYTTRLLSRIARKSLSLPLLRVFGIVILNIIFATKISKHYFEKYIFNPYYEPSTNNESISAQVELIQSLYGDVSNKTFLELGPGGNCLLACHLLAAGAKKIILLDTENHINPTKKDLEKYEDIYPNILKENGLLNNDLIQFINYDRQGRVGLDDCSVDIIYSNAVYEHVTDIRKVTKEMYRIQKRGGKSFHQVDLRDHIYNQSSLFFLSVPKSLYNLLFSQTGMWTNRLRYSIIKEHFIEAGFKIIRENIIDNGYNLNNIKVENTKDNTISSVGFMLEKL